jgi:hypothetical protein
VFGRVHCAGHRRFGERRRASGKAYVDDHPTLHYEAGDGVVGDVVVRTIDAGYEIDDLNSTSAVSSTAEAPRAIGGRSRCRHLPPKAAHRPFTTRATVLHGDAARYREWSRRPDRGDIPRLPHGTRSLRLDDPSWSIRNG